MTGGVFEVWHGREEEQGEAGGRGVIGGRGRGVVVVVFGGRGGDGRGRRRGVYKLAHPA